MLCIVKNSIFHFLKQLVAFRRYGVWTALHSAGVCFFRVPVRCTAKCIAKSITTASFGLYIAMHSWTDSRSMWGYWKEVGAVVVCVMEARPCAVMRPYK